MAKVLVVDDEEGIRSFIGECLELDGHDVEEASDGEAAVAILQARAFHVMLTDLKMPRMDGMTLLAKAKALHPEMEVFVLTAYGSVGTAVEAMKRGAFDYLQKPIESPTELRLQVKRALEHRALVAAKEREEEEESPLTWGAPSMAPVLRALRKVAGTDATVLLNGESGTGKEVAARAIHRWSKRAAGPFVAVNCAALSEALLESELFGHEKGAFTGASGRRRGKIELAEGGTFFLDEVGELRHELQAKLLRVIQEREFERVGGNQVIQADVRWVAATNRDLHRMMAEGRFREDLFHRLAVFPIPLPPLRERREDILPLAQLLLERVCRELGRVPLKLSPTAQARLKVSPWPGNVRELANVLERAVIMADGDEIDADDLWLAPLPSSASTQGTGDALSMAEVERAAIRRALEHAGGNRREAAELLGIGLRTLYDKLKRYELN